MGLEKKQLWRKHMTEAIRILATRLALGRYCGGLGQKGQMRDAQVHGHTSRFSVRSHAYGHVPVYVQWSATLLGAVIIAQQ
jgi:hypothetical protein